VFEKYANDYYKGNIKQAEICKLEGLYSHKLYRIMRKEGYKPFQRVFDDIDTGVKPLNKVLRDKYTDIIGRCTGSYGDVYGHYEGMDYLSIIGWVDFCNANKKDLNCMWEEYLKEEKSLKYSISIDRVDEKKGYLLNNMEFVTFGFNSWKRSTNRPVRVARLKDNIVKHFISCVEGDRHFNVREGTMGEILLGSNYHNKSFKVEVVSLSEVLNENNCKDIKDYYVKNIK